MTRIAREEIHAIDHTVRLNNTVNGNPRYRVYFTDGTEAVTQSDASVAYGIENSDMQGVPLLISFSRNGTIVYAKKVK
jgi:hypothetical protein